MRPVRLLLDDRPHAIVDWRRDRIVADLSVRVQERGLAANTFHDKQPVIYVRDARAGEQRHYSLDDARRYDIQQPVRSRYPSPAGQPRRTMRPKRANSSALVSSAPAGPVRFLMLRTGWRPAPKPGVGP